VAPIRQLVLVSGLTAAGKTTHSKLLAARLKWDYVGTSQLLRQLVPFSPQGKREWLPAVDAYRGKTIAVDHALDQLMRKQIDQSPRPLVVDAWLQPWLCHRIDALRVWLNSDEPSRLRKAAVSFMRDDMTPPADLDIQIREKDEFSILIFKRIYNIDFGPGPDVFDLIIDNTRFIADASVAASDRGIAAFEPDFQRIIAAYL